MIARHSRLLATLALIGLTAASAAAQTAAIGPEGPTLSVVGEGVVRGRPDMAILSLGLVSEEKTAGAALKANSASMTKIISELRRQGLDPRDMQTSGFYVEPVYTQPPPTYDSPEPFQPEIVSYRVRNELTLKMRKLDEVGRILDQAVTLGANSISGPTFTVADPSPLEDQARRAAMRDALRKGDLYAQAAGVQLGPILSINEDVSAPPRPYPAGAMARMEAQDASVPIEGGELSFEARIGVSWRIGR